MIKAILQWLNLNNSLAPKTPSVTHPTETGKGRQNFSPQSSPCMVQCRVHGPGFEVSPITLVWGTRPFTRVWYPRLQLHTVQPSKRVKLFRNYYLHMQICLLVTRMSTTAMFIALFLQNFIEKPCMWHFRAFFRGGRGMCGEQSD